MNGKTAIVALVVALAGGVAAEARADALVTQGIGTSACAKLASDLKPADGLKNPVNLMLYSWVQGYISAANLSLLEEDAKHVDLSGLDDRKVVGMVLEFCKANPDKKPVGAVDDFIRKAAKLKAKWEPGTVDWGE